MSGNKRKGLQSEDDPWPFGLGFEVRPINPQCKTFTETGNCFYSKCLDNFIQCSLFREVNSADDDKKKRTFVKQTQVLKESLLDRVKI